MDWDTKKRFGLACFLNSKPLDPDGEGDGSEFFDNAEEARTRAHKLVQAGRFKYLVLWEGGAADWEWVEEFSANPN